MVMAVRRDRVVKLKQYIKEDRPRKLRSYVRKHDLDLKGVRINKNRNLLHHCCRYGSAVILKYLLHSGVDGLHKDDEGNQPLHAALYKALQHGEDGNQSAVTELYTGVILPLIELVPGSLDGSNDSGDTCRGLLRRLVQQRRQHESSSSEMSDDEENMEEVRWRDKLAAEYEQEYASTLGRFEQDFIGSYADQQETYDDWADRLRSEYNSRKYERSHQHDNKSQKHANSKGKTDSGAGPDNLEDIRAKMREKYKKNEKEHNELKVLKLRMNYENRYKELLERRDKVDLGFDDIAWPCKKGEAGDVGVLVDGMDKEASEYRKYLRDQQIRWHPDKFLQRFGSGLKECDRDKVLQRVTALSQKLNSLLT